MHEADGTLAAEAADEVDAAELAMHGVSITLVLVHTSLAGLIRLVAGWTRAAIAARHVLTAAWWLARTCQLHALVYIFIIDHTQTSQLSSTQPSILPGYVNRVPA